LKLLGGYNVITSLKSGLTASAALLTISAVASAADIPKGTYDVTGVITASTCRTLSPALKRGAPEKASVIYPGAGQLKMILANPATATTAKPGGATTSVCVSVGKIPTTGLNNAAITFNCFTDTISGPGKTAGAQLKTKFTVGGSHSPAVSQVSIKISVVVGGKPVCTYTGDGSYVLK
jgi:hypothetical protein